MPGYSRNQRSLSGSWFPQDQNVDPGRSRLDTSPDHSSDEVALGRDMVKVCPIQFRRNYGPDQRTTNICRGGRGRCERVD